MTQPVPVFLTDIVRQPAAVHADTTAEHQGVNTRPVHQIGVIPMVDSSPDQDRAFSVGVLGGRCPFACKADQYVAANARVLLTPGRGVRRVGIVVARRIVAAEAALNAVLSHQQIVGRGNLNLRAISELDRLDRDFAIADRAGTEVIELDFYRAIAVFKEAELRVDRAPVFAVLKFQVPFAFFRTPAIAAAPFRHFRGLRLLVPHQELPFAMLLIGVFRQAARAE